MIFYGVNLTVQGDILTVNTNYLEKYLSFKIYFFTLLHISSFTLDVRGVGTSTLSYRFHFDTIFCY